MFNTLASYLLGSSSNYDTSTNNQQNNNNLIEKTDKADDSTIKKGIDINLVVNTLEEGDEDSDWLFVDKEERDSQPNTDSEEELPFVEIKNAPQIFSRGRHSRNNSGAGSHDGLLSLSPTSILPNSMEESWFVTPPPCFTSTGPIIMETSPLENLLIEHPSMSVYHRASTSIQDDADDEDMVLLDIGLEQIMHPHPAAERSPIHTVRVTRKRNDHVEHASGNNHQIKQFLGQKNALKNNERKGRQSMCRSALERSNKVREVNCKGGRQKRSDMNHCKIISRANNNRKC